MATYVMLSNLTDEGAKTLMQNPARLQEVNKEIEKLGAKVIAQYATLGAYDFVNVVEAPDNATIAPCWCSARAIAPPMPPVAPVTRAVLPDRSNMGVPLG